MHAGVAQGGLVSPVLFRLYDNDMPVTSRHVQLALYVDDPAVIATSRKSALLIRYMETYLSELERWLGEWRIAIKVSKSNEMLFANVAWRQVQFLGEPIKWTDTVRYLRVNLDSRLTCLPHIVQVRKRASQRLGVLGCLLNRRSCLSIRNGFLLYKRLICPMMDYAFPIWRCASRSYVKQLQALQSKCFRIATGAPWYISSRQIPEDLGVPFFEEHTRALTENYDSKLGGVGNRLFRQLGRYLPRSRPM
jgi:hypothetical protein